MFYSEVNPDRNPFADNVMRKRNGVQLVSLMFWFKFVCVASMFVVNDVLSIHQFQRIGMFNPFGTIKL